MSKPLQEEQGSVIQSWQQPGSLHQGNEHSNSSSTGQTQFSLKRKQRASAQDWFEERQSQKPKIAATSPNSVQSNAITSPTSEFISRNSRLSPPPQHTTFANPHFHQTHSHTHLASNQTDQRSSSSASSKMHNWRSNEQYNRREFGDNGHRSPSRDPRMGFGPDRRVAYPPPPPPPPPPSRSGGRRSSVDRGHHDRRSPPPSRREEDRDRPRDHREYRDRNDRVRPDVGSAPTGPRGAKPTPFKSAITQGYSNQQGNQFRPPDPRLVGRIDTRSGPTTETGQPGVMDMDPSNVAEGGSGTRSGSRTPNTPGTPVFGPPRQKNELHSVLLEFSNRTLQLASMEMKREAAGKEFHRVTQAFEYSRRFHEKYPSLSEQQMNNKTRAQKDLDDLNRKVKEEEMGRNRIIEAIASRVMSSSGPSIDSEVVRRLEKDISALQRDFADLRGQFADLRGSLGDIRNQVKGVGSLFGRVDKMQSRLDEFPNLRLDVDKMREELRRIINILERQNKEFKELKITVEGEDGSGGLLEFIAALEKTSADLGEVVGQAIETLEKDVVSIKEQQENRKAKDEADTAMPNARDNAKATSPVERSFWDETVIADIQQKLLDLEARLSANTESVSDIYNIHSDRDSAIAAEVERIVKLSEDNKAELEASLEEMRQNHNEAISRLDSSVLQFDSSISDIKAKVNATPPPAPQIVPVVTAQPPVVGIGRREYEHNLNLHKGKMDELQRKTSNVEAKLEANTQSLQHLDYRYNNLTTEILATNMIGQIQTNAQQELDQARKAQAMLQERIQQLSDKFDKFSALQNNSSFDILRTELAELSKTQEEQASKLVSLEEQIQSTRMSTVEEFGKHSAQIEKLYIHSKLEPPDMDDD
ncbi:hypothetical protein FGG08_003001 [Glutinoglossum americanum]|uniref:Uncharacterized protein n=1 Tax=Glutinoglossum americanum TaxID=1670608 RepID=A0A9P8IAJ5_9PEZI|nr:hypothetical protein FGG08_003001 [Glutinoglossum americanum]